VISINNMKPLAGALNPVKNSGRSEGKITISSRVFLASSNPAFVGKKKKRNEHQIKLKR